MNFFGSSKKKQVQAKAASQTPVEAIGTIKGEIKLEAVVAVAVLALDTYVSVVVPF
jgi:hypothetical protein